MESLNELIKNILLCFIPMFIAIDAFGVLPILIGLTESIDGARKKKIISQSVVTAGIVGIGFLLLGKLIFWFIGVTVNDFRIAGGLVLLVLAVLDLVTQDEKTRRLPDQDVGVFPIGTPLIAGPAVLAAIVTLSDLYGPITTFIAFLMNLGIVFVLFVYAGKVVHFLGTSGTKAAGKLSNLLLAAYAVMLIRSGVEALLRNL